MSRMMIVSNRLPMTLERQDGTSEDQQTSWGLKPSQGGLATGLKHVHAADDSLWLGWPGIKDDLDEAGQADVKKILERERCAPIFLSPGEVQAFYEDFSNGVLWPVFHYLLEQMPLEPTGFDVYREVNRKYAEAILAHYQPGDRIWIHDYQLMLVPAMVRELIPDADIGFFLHIPFPATEVFRILPWRDELLRGVLGADFIGFHTSGYMAQFEDAVRTLLGMEVDEEHTIAVAERKVFCRALPMGIDADYFEREGLNDDIQAKVAGIRSDLQGRFMILSVDRLDYTKGILRRLMTMEYMLDHEPELVGQVVLLQITAPSRTNVPAYEAYQRQVNECVGRINGRFGKPGYQPVQYLAQPYAQEDLVALYRATDVMLVSPLRDGMNLVAKEFVATRSDNGGVLVLSELAGAAQEMKQALLTNPYDLSHSSAQLKKALMMPPAEQKERMQSLRAGVKAGQAQIWCDNFCRAWSEACALRWDKGSSRDWLPSAAVHVVKSQGRLLLFLDYDGTLTPIVKNPLAAAPDAELRDLLNRLSHLPDVDVHVVSGRGRDVLEEWLGGIPVHLHGEHGMWSRRHGGSWHMHHGPDPIWKRHLRHYLESAMQKAPGSFIEEKECSLVWHYRQASEPQASLAESWLRHMLEKASSGMGLAIAPGKKIIEVRSSSVNKGDVLRHEMRIDAAAFVIALGDDITDEDMFKAVGKRGLAIHVGAGESVAPYRFKDVAGVRLFLKHLIAYRLKNPGGGRGPQLRGCQDAKSKDPLSLWMG